MGRNPQDLLTTAQMESGYTADGRGSLTLGASVHLTVFCVIFTKILSPEWTAEG